MRRRLLRAFLIVIVVGVAVLGIPLGIIASHLAREQAVRSLDREAVAIGFATAEANEKDAGIPAGALKAAAGAGRYVVVRSASGRTTIVGTRPRGRTITAQVKTAPGATITVAASAEESDERAVQAWLLVAGLGAAGVAVAVLLANRESKRLGRPLDDLAQASRRLGAGDLSARVAPVGISELDAVGDALATSGERITDLIRREREFSANASHQLRTPLTALRVRLEEAAMGDATDMTPALTDAFAEVDRLEATITDLLALSRSAPNDTQERAPISQIMNDLRRRWAPLLNPGDRRLDIEAVVIDDALPARPVAEILNVLVENALRHGEGTIHIGSRRSGAHLVLTVSDEGPGIEPGLEQAIFTRHVSGGEGTGVGLALARTLAHSVDGRLELTDPRPATFELYIPSHPTLP